MLHNGDIKKEEISRLKHEHHVCAKHSLALTTAYIVYSDGQGAQPPMATSWHQDSAVGVTVTNKCQNPQTQKFSWLCNWLQSFSQLAFNLALAQAFYFNRL